MYGERLLSTNKKNNRTLPQRKGPETEKGAWCSLQNRHNALNFLVGHQGLEP